MIASSELVQTALEMTLPHEINVDLNSANLSQSNKSSSLKKNKMPKKGILKPSIITSNVDSLLKNRLSIKQCRFETSFNNDSSVAYRKAS